jgi:toxin ParE1/3/4
MRSRLSAEAKKDLAEIRDYIARDKPTAAATTVRSIRDVLRTVISRFPETGASCDELSPGLRCFPVGNYVVFYRIDKTIDVVRILHGARDIGAIFHTG